MNVCGYKVAHYEKGKHEYKELFCPAVFYNSFLCSHQHKYTYCTVLLFK